MFVLIWLICLTLLLIKIFLYTNMHVYVRTDVCKIYRVPQIIDISPHYQIISYNDRRLGWGGGGVVPSLSPTVFFSTSEIFKISVRRTIADFEFRSFFANYYQIQWVVAYRKHQNFFFSRLFAELYVFEVWFLLVIWICLFSLFTFDCSL